MYDKKIFMQQYFILVIVHYFSFVSYGKRLRNKNSTEFLFLVLFFYSLSLLN